MDSAGKRLRISPENALRYSVDPDISDDVEQRELRLPWFRSKDVANAQLHLIKATQKPKSEVVDSTRINIIADVEWEVKRLEEEALMLAKGPVEGRTCFLSNAVQAVADYYHICSATVNAMRKALKENGSPKKKERPGRQRVYGDAARTPVIEALNSGNGRTIEQAEKLLETSFELETATTYNNHTRHSPSTGTVFNIKHEGRIVRANRRPFLSMECMQARFSFAESLLSSLALKSDRPEVHLDEAYFTLAFGGTGVLIDHPSHHLLESAKVKFLKSRSHPTQIMVLIAVAKPILMNPLAAGEQGVGEIARFDKKQDGKVAIFRIVEKSIRKKKWSKMDKDGKKTTHEKGDVIVRPANLNSNMYQDLMTRPLGILDKIRTYFGPDVVVKLQEDGAPPHGRITKNTIAKVGVHEKMVAVAMERSIDLVRQPPNSPEINVCDLGIWRSLQSRVKAENLEDISWRSTHTNQEHLWKVIEKVWSELQPKTVFNVFEVRNEIARELVENHGGAIVKEPHVGIRKKWGTG